MTPRTTDAPHAPHTSSGDATRSQAVIHVDVTALLCALLDGDPLPLLYGPNPEPPPLDDEGEIDRVSLLLEHDTPPRAVAFVFAVMHRTRSNGSRASTGNASP